MDKAAVTVENSVAIGRPRDREKQLAVLEATRDILREEGYQQVTVQKVAKLAGVTRFLVYKWWDGSIPMLVQEALFSDSLEKDAPNTGALATDVEHLLADMVKFCSEPHFIAAIPALVADLQHDQAAASKVYKQFTLPFLNRWRMVFAQALARGELSSEPDASMYLAAVNGALQQLLLNKMATKKQIARFLTHMVTASLTN